jgi:periplasmic protein TonB
MKPQRMLLILCLMSSSCARLTVPSPEAPVTPPKMVVAPSETRLPSVPTATSDLPSVPAMLESQPSATPAPPRPAQPLATQPAEEVLRVGGDVIAPEPIEPRAQPDFRRLGRVQGVPVVEAVISATGEVTEARMLKPINPEFDAAVLDTVRQWRFKPATQNGKPVSVYYVLTFGIRLQ